MMTTTRTACRDPESRSTLHNLFEASALTHPHGIAVVFDDGDTVSMATYTEIQSYSGRIADALSDVGCENQCIGLYCEPTLQIPAVLLGILESSCAFVPLDPHAPLHINTHMISATQLQVVLLQSNQLMSFLDTIGTAFPNQFALDEERLAGEDVIIVRIKHNGNQHVTSYSNEGLAYVMHSSGTTSQPKVIRVPHKCIVPNIVHLREAFNVFPNDVIFNAATLTFDTSIVEIFLALSQGASVLMVPPAVRLMPRRLMGILMRNHVTIIQATPTLVQRFDGSLLRGRLFGDDSPLRIMAFGGESCPTPAMIHQWRAKDNKTQFYNIYGITEVSCWASLYRIPDVHINDSVNQSVPIGEPLRGTLLEVRDDVGKPVSSGQGTLFIGGTDRVCFLDKEDVLLTSDTVMRNSGDCVEFTDRGLVCLGRRDDQVKRHGKRITLTQIQQIVEMMDSVSSCAVVLEDHQLLLFCVPVNKELTLLPQCIAPTDTFMLELNDILPSHGLPDMVFWVGDLPVTLHGKVDKCGLAQLSKEIQNAGDTIIDDSCISKKLYELWKCLLRHGTSIEPNSNFLELGGDSFKSIQMSTTMETWIRRPLKDFVDILLHKSFQDVVSYVEEVVSRHKEIQAKDRRTSRPVDSELLLKRSHVDLMQGQSSEFIQGIEKDSKCTVVKRTASNSICPSAITGNRSICNNQISSDSLTVIQNADGATASQNATGKPHICNPSTTIIPSHNAAFSPTCIRWQYSIRRGSQMKWSNRQHQGQLSCWNSNMSDDITKDSTGNSLGLIERWKYNTGKCVDASPLIVRWRSCLAVVYIGSHSHTFVAVAMETGVALWECRLGDRIESSACLSMCGQFVIVGCYDNSVYFLNSDSGSVFWRFRTEGSVKSSPVADAESSLVYVGSHDQYLYALNVKSKTCEWRIHCGGGSVFSSPCVYYPEHTVYVGTLAGELLAIYKESGILRWRYRCPKPIFSSPAVSGTGVIVGCADGLLYCISHSGDKLWTYGTAAPIFSSPCVFSTSQSSLLTQSSDVCDNYIVFGSHDHMVHCLDKTTGKMIWRKELPSQVYSTPFIFKCEKIIQNRKDGYDNYCQEPIGDDCSQEPIKKHFRLTAKDVSLIGYKIGTEDGIASNDCNQEPIKKHVRLHPKDHCSIGAGLGTDDDTIGNISHDMDTPGEHQDGIQNCNSISTGSACKNPMYVAASCTSGVLAILDMSTGSILGSYTLPGEVFSSPLFHEGKIIVGCRDDSVYCISIT